MEIFTEYTALAALAVVAVQQFLKLNVIPVYFANQFPIVTNILLSIAAAVYVNWQNLNNLTGLKSWLLQIASISIVAAITYNSTLKNSVHAQQLTDRKGPDAK